MSLHVKWATQPKKYLRKMQPNRQKLIRKGVELFAATGRGDVEKVKGQENTYRLRLGGYRVLFTYLKEELAEEQEGIVEIDILYVVRLRPRGDVYKR